MNYRNDISRSMLIGVVGLSCLIVLQTGAQTPFVEKQGVIFQAQPDTLAWKRYPIEGYGNKTSVLQGDPINFMVAAGRTALSGSTYQIRIYRIGATDSLYSNLGTFTLQYQPLTDSVGDPIYPGQFNRHPKNYKRGCSWSTTYTLTVPLSWKSGFYYVKCTLTSDSTVSRRIPFVVRQKYPGSTSKILYQASFSEYYAYAAWGGGSLYWWTDSAHTLDETDTVSFLRPLGGNFGPDATNDLGSFDDYEKNFIKWAEQSGYVMEYCTNTDIDFDSDPANLNQYSFISNYSHIVIGGHDEYCSGFERTAIELRSLRPPGDLPSKNVAFLSANMFYWRVAYTNNRTRMWCHKSDDNLWRNQLEGPEAKFIGVQYETGYNYARTIDTVRLSTHWLFNGTGLQNGNRFGFGQLSDNPGILGAEVDHTYPGASPWNVQILTSAWVDSTIIAEQPIVYGPVLHESVFYVDTTSNARVFGAGSQLWSSGLWSYDAQDKTRFRAFATNLMDHFSGKKYVGDIWASSTWGSNVQIDGNVYLKPGRILTLSNSMILTIDAGDTLFLDGTLQVNSTITINGGGAVRINPSGRITTANNTTLTIATGVTLIAQPGSSVYFGQAGTLTINGRLLAEGNSSNHITFTSSSGTPTRGIWNQVRLNGIYNSLKYCDFRYPTYGLYIANTSTNLIDHCTFSDCNFAGIYALGTGGWYDNSCLITNSTFTNTSRGLLAANARAAMQYCTVQNNGSPIGYGVYASNSTIYIDHNSIQNHYTAGAYITGASAYVGFGTWNLGNGCNTLTQSSKQVFLTNGGRALLGDGWTGSPISALNNIYNATGYLVQNICTTTVRARQCYWGSPIIFIGPIDTQHTIGSQQCTGGAPAQAIAGGGSGIEEGTGDELISPFTADPTNNVLGGGEYDITTIPIEQWLKEISNNDETSAMSLTRLAAIRMEVRESLEEQLGGTWEEYLNNVETSASRPDLFETARVQRIKTLIDGRMLERAGTLIDHTLMLKISDELWSYCQGQKVYGNLLAGNGEEADRVLQALRQATDRIDASGIEDLERMVEGFREGTGLLVSAQTYPRRDQTLPEESPPTAYALEQNYPNPFNPSTTIAYSLPEGVHVLITVYDILGREVITLVNEVQSAGVKTVRFDGSALPNGVYFYKMRAGDFRDTKKLLLMR